MSLRCSRCAPRPPRGLRLAVEAMMHARDECNSLSACCERVTATGYADLAARNLLRWEMERRDHARYVGKCIAAAVQGLVEWAR